ncbi:MAG TPA: NAD-dependent epimerase/dehydratase family protein [Acidobacteriota bacterium]|nr:NAD-dependent epimerase/dehydratase family protein [Acidobacteriota bacterium]
MKCVVTGGTGFLGSAVVRLLRQAGHQADIVSRSRGHDIARPDTLRQPFRQADVVFHLAALVQSRPGPFEQTNLQGLENVFQVCRDEGVKRIINVSSFTIFGPSGGQPHRESHMPERQSFFHGYDETKYRGYQMTLEWKKELRINTVFPTVIYGPGPLTEGNIMARLLGRWASMRVAALQRGGRPVWNFVYVEDVARGLLSALEAPPGEDFILGGQDVSLNQLLGTFRQVSGRRILRLPLPDPVFRLGARLEDWTSRLVGFPPMVLPSTADFFLNDWQFSSEKAQSRLDYSPTPLAEGLQATWQWMRAK